MNRGPFGDARGRGLSLRGEADEEAEGGVGKYGSSSNSLSGSGCTSWPARSTTRERLEGVSADGLILKKLEPPSAVGVMGIARAAACCTGVSSEEEDGAELLSEEEEELAEDSKCLNASCSSASAARESLCCAPSRDVKSEAQ